MAHLKKRKSGKWTAEIRQPDNKYISKTFLKKSNASNWAREMEYLLDKQQYEDFSDSARLTLGDLIMRYRDEITPTKKGSACEGHKLNLMLRHKIAKCRLLELKAKNIFDFKSDIRINRKPATINKYIHYIYTIWETARIQWDIALPSRNPASLVSKEKIKTKIDRILSPDEYRDLLVAGSKSNLPFLADIIEFAYITAMRFGEITKLEVKDIDFHKSIAKLLDTKNGEDRAVPLTKRALEICNKYRFRNALFDIKRDQFRHYYEQACRRAHNEFVSIYY